MILSRLTLDPDSRAVRRDVADAQGMHRTVMNGFRHVGGQNPRESLAVLWRAETSRRSEPITLLVQASEPPDWSRLPDGYLADVAGRPNPAIRPLDDAWGRLRVGGVLAFRLRANVTRKIGTKSGPDGEKENGTRVPVAGDEARIGWLMRKAFAHGFELVVTEGGPDLRVTESAPIRARREGAHATFAGVTFDGRLHVTDVERFRAALAAGIGPAKAYGFGLLSIAPG